MNIQIPNSKGTLEGTLQWYQNQPPLVDSPICQIVKNLGQGEFSSVERVSYQNREWALKRPIKNEGKECITLEADILGPLNRKERELGLEYVVQMVALITLKQGSMTLFSLYQGGDLFSFLERTERGLDLESSLKITCQMLNALSFLEGEGVVHRDIKLDNILIAGDGTIRLADFGLAMRIGSKKDLSGFHGSFEHMSQEILEAASHNDSREVPYGFRSDMWATGYTVYFVFSRWPLFEFNPKEVQKAQPQNVHQEIEGLKRTPELSREIAKVQQELQNLNEVPKRAIQELDRLKQKQAIFDEIPQLKEKQSWFGKEIDSHMRMITERKGLGDSSSLRLFLDVMKGMLALDPEKRLTPQKALAYFQETMSPAPIDQESLSNA